MSYSSDASSGSTSDHDVQQLTYIDKQSMSYEKDALDTSGDAVDMQAHCPSSPDSPPRNTPFLAIAKSLTSIGQSISDTFAPRQPLADIQVDSDGRPLQQQVRGMTNVMSRKSFAARMLQCTAFCMSRTSTFL